MQEVVWQNKGITVFALYSPCYVKHHNIFFLQGKKKGKNDFDFFNTNIHYAEALLELFSLLQAVGFFFTPSGHAPELWHKSHFNFLH